MTRRIIFGDSHIACMYQLQDTTSGGLGALFPDSFELRWVHNGAIALNLSYNLANGAWLRHPFITKTIAESGLADNYSGVLAPGKPDTLVMFLLGSVSSHLIGFNPELRPYCLTPTDDGRTYLPPAVLTETIREHLKSMIPVFAELSAAKHRVCILGGPPPHRDNAFIRTHQNRENLPEPDTRLGVFRALCGALGKIAAESDAQFLDCSPWLADEDGFLKEAFERDGVHTNMEGARAWLTGVDAVTRSS